MSKKPEPKKEEKKPAAAPAAKPAAAPAAKPAAAPAAKPAAAPAAKPAAAPAAKPAEKEPEVKWKIPDNLLYTKTHQWFDGKTGKVGLTAYATDKLGEISFVDLDGIDGAELTQLEMSGDNPASDPIDANVESSKAVGDLYSPVSGTVKEINSALMDAPEMINEDPYGKGWLFAIDASNLDEEKGKLLPAKAYKAFVAKL